MSYSLLPFTFTRVAGREVLVNELGDMIVTDPGTVEALLDASLPVKNPEFYKTLVANFFIREESIPSIMDIYANRLREKKRFLEEWTALHIFVLTLQCNQNCVYCQASSREHDSKGCTMSPEVLKRSVELMFHSPAPVLTMEFQGGEPSLHPELVRLGVETAEEMRRTDGREVRYVLCTNCVDLDEQFLDYCRQRQVLISTSLDGPAWLHNANRGKRDSYERVVAGIARAREVLGRDKVSALMTTSVQALDWPEAIVDEYLSLGFDNIFLRALNPYGLAVENDNWLQYTDRFVVFYRRAFEHILKLNCEGTFFVEDFAQIVLRKMLTPFCTGFVDLQSPAGTVGSVLVYNYDGGVYASDESRMLAEQGDYTFKIGSVWDNYKDIVYGPKVQQMAQLWANETLAGCSDCVWRVYCGADPVRNHSVQGDMYGHRPTSMLCRKYKAIIGYLVELLVTRRDEVLPVFKSWLQ